MLIVLVLAIWGVIGYQMLSVVNSETAKVFEQDFVATFNPKVKTEVDTFSIQIANRDPFMGTLLVKKKVKIKSLSKTKNIKAIWMPITYHGNISNQNKKTTVYIISIGGSQYLMKVGQQIKDLKLVKGNMEYVQLSYKGAVKIINKT